ncbi:SLATT domain-containing protein [Oerskovia sp. NPDC060287]|uniref:SLATT domain-containing protein n=1 Tax=Oerskovia sp. NPDC060287 TaxID=3347095 RepID=UPI003664E65E
MSAESPSTGPSTDADATALDFRVRADSELQTLQEDLLWTEKAHFARAETLSRVNFWIGLVGTVSAATAVGAIVTERSPLIASLAALAAAIASGLLTFLKPPDLEKRHLDAGRRLGALRVRVRQAIRFDVPPGSSTPTHELRALARTFADEKAEIDADSPATSGRAFSAARKKIEAGHFEHADGTPSARPAAPAPRQSR